MKAVPLTPPQKVLAHKLHSDYLAATEATRNALEALNAHLDLVVNGPLPQHADQMRLRRATRAQQRPFLSEDGNHVIVR